MSTAVNRASRSLRGMQIQLAARLGDRYRWLVWSAISLLAFNQNLQTFAYPVLLPSLLAELNLSYSLAGGLMSAYILAMASVMIPVGLLADRIGGRSLSIVGLAVLSAGTFLFATAGNYPLAVLSRVLVGLGAAAAIVLPSPMLAFWFSKQQYGSVLGIHVSAGKTGSILATWALPPLIVLLGWRLGYSVVSLAGPIALLAAVLFMANGPEDVRLSPKGSFAVPKAAQKQAGQEGEAIPFRRLARDRGVLLLTMAQLFYLSTYYGVINWLPTYLKVEAGLTEVDAGFTTGLLLWGTIVGFALTGPVSMRIGSYRPLYAGGALVTAGLTVLFAGAVILTLPRWTWTPVMFIYGLCLSNMVLVMPILAGVVPRRVLGAASGFVFAVSFLGPVVAPALVGAVADATGSLRTAMWFPVATGLVCFAISLFVREGAQGQADLT